MKEGDISLEMVNTGAKLQATAQMTHEIAKLQSQVTQLGVERRSLWRELWQAGISQRKIGAACGVTGQTVHNEIKREG